MPNRNNLILSLGIITIVSGIAGSLMKLNNTGNYAILLYASIFSLLGLVILIFKSEKVNRNQQK